MPPPDDVERAMHTARTSAKSVPVAKRLYSHAWLEDRNHRSMLPDDLRPVKPVIFGAVGVSVNTMSKRPERIEAAAAMERAISQVVGNAYESGITDPAKIKEIIARV